MYNQSTHHCTGCKTGVTEGPSGRGLDVLIECKLERYWRVNLLGPDPCLMKKEFTGPQSHKGWEALCYRMYNQSTHHCTDCKTGVTEGPSGRGLDVLIECKLERYWRVNLLGPGPCLMKKEFTGPQPHKGCVRLQNPALDGACVAVISKFAWLPYYYCCQMWSSLARHSFVYWTRKTVLN